MNDLFVTGGKSGTTVQGSDHAGLNKTCGLMAFPVHRMREAARARLLGSCRSPAVCTGPHDSATRILADSLLSLLYAGCIWWQGWRHCAAVPAREVVPAPARVLLLQVGCRLA